MNFVHENILPRHIKKVYYNQSVVPGMMVKEGVENKTKLYHDVGILLKKYNITPDGNPYLWIYFEEGDIDGSIKIINGNKLNITYWVRKEKNERENINIQELEEILISWYHLSLIHRYSS